MEDLYELKGKHIATFEPHLFSSDVEHCCISNVTSNQCSCKQCYPIAVYAMRYSLIFLVDTGLKELYLPLLVTGIHCTKLWVWKHICQYKWSWDKPYSPGCNHLCPMLQFGSKHVCIEDVHIFKHCHEMTKFLLWIGTYCISRVGQQTSGVKDLSFLVRYDDNCLGAIRHIQSIIRAVRSRPNIRSRSVLF